LRGSLYYSAAEGNRPADPRGAPPIALRPAVDQPD
jgi:hypothetical protein